MIRFEQVFLNKAASLICVQSWYDRRIARLNSSVSYKERIYDNYTVRTGRILPWHSSQTTAKHVLHQSQYDIPFYASLQPCAFFFPRQTCIYLQGMNDRTRPRLLNKSTNFSWSSDCEYQDVFALPAYPVLQPTEILCIPRIESAYYGNIFWCSHRGSSSLWNYRSNSEQHPLQKEK